MPSLDFFTGELIDRKDISDTLAVFRFRIDEQLCFTAGQYTTIGLKCDGEFIERPYSIVSSPYERTLEFFIELVPNGLFTPQLWKLKPRATIQIRQRVVGHFTLDPSSDRHLMIATVTGVAPFISMIRTRHYKEGSNGNHDQFLLIHGASHSTDFGPYRSELEGLCSEGWLTYVPTISRPWDEPNWRGEIGRVEDIVRKHADQLSFSSAKSIAYVCGHPQMIANVKNLLTRARYLKHQIRDEQYFALHDFEVSQTRTRANDFSGTNAFS
jgi:ferredoxin--NADP+ reductase